jgi:8-oxo-dGTP pyrophosphatase MutT (NUDIX family)
MDFKSLFLFAALMEALCAKLAAFRSPLVQKVATLEPSILPRASVVIAIYSQHPCTLPPSLLHFSESTTPLTDNFNENLYIWFNLRAKNLSHHPGEVCFPGGKRDKTDIDDIAAGLREAKEEFGLTSPPFQYLTCLAPSLSRSLSVVIPIVGIIQEDSPLTSHNTSDRKRFKPKLAEDEVSCAFSVPLNLFSTQNFHSFYDIQLNRPWLEVPYSYRVHSFHIPASACHHIMTPSAFSSPPRPSSFKIWGLTAQFLVQLVHLIYPSHAIQYSMQSPCAKSTYTQIAEHYIDWCINNSTVN